MHVCIVGGGVIGISTAYFLAREGHEVTLLEANNDLAEGTSYANGAQLCYSYVAPLADPTVLKKIPGWLLNPSSPMRFAPRLDWQQWRWCVDFLKYCRRDVAQSVTTDLLHLGALSRENIHALLNTEPLDFNYQQNGKLVIYREEVGYVQARRQQEFQVSQGSNQQALNGTECIDLEPALASLEGKLAGGIYTPTEEAGDCRRFTQGLAEAAKSKFGVKIVLDARARGLRQERERIVAVQTNHGDVQADAFVVAAGNGSSQLLEALGIKLPIYPLTGYSLTAPVASDNESVPNINITDMHHKTVYARLGQKLRVAGMADLIGRNRPADQRRVALLKRQAYATFPDAADYQNATSWCGSRPATPDSKPFIGAAPIPNLWLNTGHGGLGFTLACGSAALLAHVMEGRTPPIDITPFTIARLSR